GNLWSENRGPTRPSPKILPRHFRLAAIPPHRFAPRDAVHVIFDRVPRANGLTEFRLVDGEKEHRCRLRTGRRNAEHSGGLGHSFDHQHARKYRVAGEMTLELRFIDGHVLDADTVLVTLNVDHAINHQKWISVRQQFKHHLDILFPLLLLKKKKT